MSVPRLLRLAEGDNVYVADAVVATATGRPSGSEGLGHREFVLTYKSSEPAGPSCLPLTR